MVSSYTNRHLGVILVSVSAIVFSCAGVFTKAVQAGAWEIIFWRGVFAAGFTTVYIMRYQSFKPEFFGMKYSGLLVALIGASGMAAFIPAFKLTTIANVILIYAAAPVIAALMAWFWIKERTHPRILIGSGVAIVGVFIIVNGSTGDTSILGDMLALWMTIAMSIIMVIYRRYPATPTAGPATLSSMVLIPVALFLGNPLHVELAEIAILAVFGLTFAIASVALAEGMKRLPAGETALLSILETPLAPIFGWLFFSEIPKFTTLIGGVVILIAVLATQLQR